MKDSQLTRVLKATGNKYIKANNERFSTEFWEQVVTL